MYLNTINSIIYICSDHVVQALGHQVWAQAVTPSDHVSTLHLGVDLNLEIESLCNFTFRFDSNLIPSLYGAECQHRREGSISCINMRSNELQGFGHTSNDVNVEALLRASIISVNMSNLRQNHKVVQTCWNGDPSCTFSHFSLDTRGDQRLSCDTHRHMRYEELSGFGRPFQERISALDGKKLST